jgi:hypothetical protein
MKTTIEISDPLLLAARERAASEGITLRALIERALHRVVADNPDKKPFKLRRASFKGNGLQAEFRDSGWESLREAAYQDRGG